MASRSEPAKVSELLALALSADVGGEPVVISELRRLSGGASRETWSFSANGRPLILRRDPPGRPSPHGTMRNEADVMTACRRAGLAVPEVLFHSDGEELGTAGLVMSSVPGETIPRRILRDETFDAARTSLLDQIAEFLAGLHSIDPCEVPGAVESDELGIYRFAYDMVEDSSPCFERSFEWLEATRRTSTTRTLVHGDLRMGNLIVDRTGLAAVIDWELLHLGDPIEDLAWFCVKAWRFGSPLEAGGLGAIEDFIARYEAAAGREVDRDTFHWWLVEKTLAWGVICMGQAYAHLSGAVRSHELAAVGRRVAEQEWDLLELLAPEAAASARPTGIDPQSVVAEAVGQGPSATGTARSAIEFDAGVFGRPTALEMLEAVRAFLSDDVMAQSSGRLSYQARVAANMVGIVERELLARQAGPPQYVMGGTDSLPTWESIADVVVTKVTVANPRHLERRHVDPLSGFSSSSSGDG